MKDLRGSAWGIRLETGCSMYTNACSIGTVTSKRATVRLAISFPSATMDKLVLPLGLCVDRFEFEVQRNTHDEHLGAAQTAPPGFRRASRRMAAWSPEFVRMSWVWGL